MGGIIVAFEDRSERIRVLKSEYIRLHVYSSKETIPHMTTSRQMVTGQI